MECEKAKGSFFRQTMFAEFEMSMHLIAERKPIPFVKYCSTEETEEDAYHNTSQCHLSMTPDALSGVYKELNDLYYGDRDYLTSLINETGHLVVPQYLSSPTSSSSLFAPAGQYILPNSSIPHNLHSSSLISWEFLRVPHMYYNFYVYKYATSYAAAQILATRIYQEYRHHLNTLNESQTNNQSRHVDFSPLSDDIPTIRTSPFSTLSSPSKSCSANSFPVPLTLHSSLTQQTTIPLLADLDESPSFPYSSTTSSLTKYLHFLSSGCSQDPLKLLQDAGVDLSKPDAVSSALDIFSSSVDELSRLLEQLQH